MTQGFDDWMNKNHSGAFDMPHHRDCFEAGAASRQAEIDELQKRIDFLERVDNGLKALKILKGESNE